MTLNPRIFFVSALFAVSLSLFGPAQAAPPSFQTSAKQAILIDYDTGAVLFEKNADTPMFPASMTKIMTALLAFEQIKAGQLQLDGAMRVSETARKGGSKMFVRVGDEVIIEDLLRGIIVQSGNDASNVMAEGISGSEEAFAELMTERAAISAWTERSFGTQPAGLIPSTSPQPRIWRSSPPT